MMTLDSYYSERSMKHRMNFTSRRVLSGVFTDVPDTRKWKRGDCLNCCNVFTVVGLYKKGKKIGTVCKKCGHEILTSTLETAPVSDITGRSKANAD